MIIGQIKDGIVLDHISAGNGMVLYNLLGLANLDCQVALIQNADSVKMGKKDIIKVDRVIDLNFDVLGYVDPGVTVNIIKDGKRYELSYCNFDGRKYKVKNILKYRANRYARGNTRQKMVLDIEELR